MWSLWLMDAALAVDGNFIARQTTILDRIMSLVGIAAMVGFAWLISENRKKIDWRPVTWGVGAQLLLGAVITLPAVSNIFYTVVNTGVNKLLSFSDEGAKFIFGSFVPHQIMMGGEAVASDGISAPLVNFAFTVLPTIVFFSSLMSVLYYLGFMQALVSVIAKLMVKTLGTSGAESLSAAGNIFVGQTEAPLLVRPFVEKMTRSELMAVMTGGFATVAGGVMGAYVSFLGSIPNIAGHLVMASIMSAPAALAIAKILVPETEEPLTKGEVQIDADMPVTNVMEAAAVGASDGMKLALNVAAMLIAIVGLVSMLDWMIGLLPVGFCGDAVVAGYTCDGQPATPMSLSVILGWLFAPVAFLMGVPWAEASIVGTLLGEKIVLTEFIAYIHLSGAINAETAVLSERSAIIASYGLCGFANFASIGIQLGGIGGIAPKRMGDLAALGFKAMTGGVIAACMTGAVAGLFLG